MRYAPLVLVVLAGCFGPGVAQVPVLSPYAASVRVGKADPDPSCRDLGPIEAVHGNGCGGFGDLGNYEGAYNLLRNGALARGANYVRMDQQQAPHSENGCYDDRYQIRGVAFACSTTASAGADATR